MSKTMDNPHSKTRPCDSCLAQARKNLLCLFSAQGQSFEPNKVAIKELRELNEALLITGATG